MGTETLTDRELERVDEIIADAGCSREAAVYIVVRERAHAVDVFDEQPDGTLTPAA